MRRATGAATDAEKESGPGRVLIVADVDARGPEPGPRPGAAPFG